MTADIVIALDAMGGDNAPNMVVDGAALVVKKRSGIRFLIFGDEARLQPLVDAKPELQGMVELRHTVDVVRASDKPSQALRQGRNSSMRLAINAVAAGEAAGVVSAGNTGALMAMSKFVLKTLPGIDRPAICSVLPTIEGRSVMLDLGANIVCDSDNLVQFAIMGSAFARTVMEVPRPRVALLNVGAEELKGNDAVRTAAGVLRDAELPMAFHGFVEGDDIAKGTVDVVVTDGFSGNVALKAVEGTSKLFSAFLRTAFTSSLLARMGYFLALPAMKKLRERIDPRLYNGGVFLGLNGICVKSHGGTDAVGFANATQLVADLVADNLIGKINADMAHLVTIDMPQTRAVAS